MKQNCHLAVLHSPSRKLLKTYKEPESAWAKVVKPALQGQVTAGCSRLSGNTSLSLLRGRPGKGNGAFHPKEVGDEEFKTNCILTLLYILSLVADITEIIWVWFRNYITSWPDVFEARFRSQQPWPVCSTFTKLLSFSEPQFPYFSHTGSMKSKPFLYLFSHLHLLNFPYPVFNHSSVSPSEFPKS